MSEGADIERRVAAALNDTALPYEIIGIDPQYADTAAFCERSGFPLENSANTIIVASKKMPKTFSASVVRANARLDANHGVRKLMGVSRVSFASAEETAELTGMMIGGVTALALPSALPIYVDDGLMRLDYVILGGGSRSSKIKIAPDVFHRLPHAQIIPGLAGT